VELSAACRVALDRRHLAALLVVVVKLGVDLV